MAFESFNLKRMNVFDLLAKRSGRESLSELQKRELRKNVVSDFVDFLYIRNLFGLRVIRWLKLKVDSVLFGQLVYPYLKFYVKTVITLPHYQSILDLLASDIRKALDSHGIEIELNGIDDVGRWSIMNAEYISTFGFDSRISVNSGMLYFLHVFCRNLQPFLMKDEMPKRRGQILLWLMKRQFKSSAIAFCTNNHRKIISMVSMVPKDGTLLEGMEMFMLCHEIGHAYYSQYGNGVWPFKKSIGEKESRKMNNDEEYAADIFSIHMLQLMDENQKGKYFLYGACLFFMILSWFEETGFIKKPVKHPLSKERYDYLLDEIKGMDEDLYDRCQEYSNIMNSVWLLCKDDIGRGIDRYRKKRSKYEDELEVVREYARHYFRCEECGEE